MNGYTVSVTVEGQTSRDVPAGTAVSALAPKQEESGLPLLAALVNNDLVSLSYPLRVNCSVRFLTMEDPHGWRIYRRSLCFLLGMTVHDLYPEAEFSVDHSFGLGLYCSFTGRSKNGMSDEERNALATSMQELVQSNLPIERGKIGYCEAVELFATPGLEDKAHLLAHRNPPHVVMHRCGNFSDLAHGPLVPETGTLQYFQLIPHPPGFILHLPDREHPRTIPPFVDHPHLFQVFQEHKQWGRILGVSTAGKLNEIIMDGQFPSFVRTAEALHDKKLSRIADTITEGRDKIRVVLIAGPSCSGKTTFAKRLTSHLMVNGIRPVTLGTDDYFVGPKHTPKDADGKLDYEHINAVDLPCFNQDLIALIQRQPIRRIVYNFGLQRREGTGQELRLADDQVLIIEGIHALNPQLTKSVPDYQKFGIYVSALTQLSMDRNNRISTTDNRLVRRLIRDHNFRGHSALETLQLWPSVRRGEKRWIFPFQGQADVAFNSALDYELAVLKPLAEALLSQIKPCHAEYAEARRLSEFLLNFLSTPDHSVPGDSILREYIGNSQLEY